MDTSIYSRRIREGMREEIMARQTREKLFEDVWRQLNKKPMTTHQIAKATLINWETVKKTISVLKSIGQIRQKTINGKKHYFSHRINYEEMTPEKLLNELKINKYISCAIVCPNCNKEGNFGSVRLFNEDKRQFIICGWCNQITINQNRTKYYLHKEQVKDIRGSKKDNLSLAKKHLVTETHIKEIKTGKKHKASHNVRKE